MVLTQLQLKESSILLGSTFFAIFQQETYQRSETLDFGRKQKFYMLWEMFKNFEQNIVTCQKGLDKQ